MITNNKFKLLNESLKAMGKGNLNILTLFSNSGTGKTYTTLEYLNKQNIN